MNNHERESGSLLLVDRNCVLSRLDVSIRKIAGAADSHHRRTDFNQASNRLWLGNVPPLPCNEFATAAFIRLLGNKFLKHCKRSGLEAINVSENLGFLG